jgi:uncharacterized protein YdeI (YjbR/CyaY-like superfamily)
VPSPTNITFFRNAAAFRAWLEKNHATRDELWIGYYKKSSGKAGLTYAEAVEEILCYGWIDGITKSIDADSYAQRLTPRRPGSNWSAINIAHVERLKKAGRMQPAGLAAFALRTKEKSGIYSYEKRPEQWPRKYEAVFKKHKAAWDFFSAQPPGYRRLALFYIVSAKQEATREKRLKHLIETSAAKKRLR